MSESNKRAREEEENEYLLDTIKIMKIQLIQMERILRNRAGETATEKPETTTTEPIKKPVEVKKPAEILMEFKYLTLEQQDDLEVGGYKKHFESAETVHDQKEWLSLARKMRNRPKRTTTNPETPPVPVDEKPISRGKGGRGLGAGGRIRVTVSDDEDSEISETDESETDE